MAAEVRGMTRGSVKENFERVLDSPCCKFEGPLPITKSPGTPSCKNLRVLSPYLNIPVTAMDRRIGKCYHEIFPPRSHPFNIRFGLVNVIVICERDMCAHCTCLLDNLRRYVWY